MTVPFSTDKTSLTPAVIHTGASVSPGTGASQNFTSPVTYTVTDGAGSIKVYSVTVKIWAKTFGGTSLDYGYSTCTDNDKNVFITGGFNGTADFGGGAGVASKGGSDIFIVKYSSDGTYKWAKTFGTSVNYEYGYSVCTDADGNVYVTGTIYSMSVDFGGGIVTSTINDQGMGVFVVKYDSEGTYIWAKQFGGNWNDLGRSICTDKDGNVYVTGGCTGANGGTVDFGDAPVTLTGSLTNFFVIKYDTDGSYKWVKTVDGNYLDDYGNSVSTDSSGNVLITGNIGGIVNFGGGSITTTGGDDIFIAKYSSNGAYKWAKVIPGYGRDSGYSICTDKNDNIYITGTFYNEADFGGGSVTAIVNTHDHAFIAKYTSNGAYVWSKTYNGNSSEYGRSVCTDKDNNVYVTGEFLGTANFGGGNVTANLGNDTFLAKYTTDGTYIWTKFFSGAGSHDYGYSTCIDLSGNLYVAGYFFNTINFGDGNVTSNGSYDVFLVNVLNE